MHQLSAEDSVMPVVSSTQSVKRFSNDDTRWRAVVNRDIAANGSFVYSVRTTGVYCRPICAAKLPQRKNVSFHATCEDAEKAGFRPCKRCKPADASLHTRRAAIVAQACRLIEATAKSPGLFELADAVAMSPFHFHRLFKTHTGITPKQYAAAHRAQQMRHALSRQSKITDAIYDAGFNSNGRFYESSTQMLGMTPKAYRSGGAGATVRFAIGECWLGSILVAASQSGVCAISLGDDPDKLARELQDQFPNAQVIGGDAEFEQLVAKVVGFLETPAIGIALPLDIRGTAFQRCVWEALQKIPLGSTVTYTDIAKQIGKPNSVRAVASACAANKLAVAIPCHRVVRTDGSLSGYRWGVERKAKLLEREQASRTNHSRPPAT
jgi:AraC family transcriptional regulator of adaptative response/methylated-DNA-[protein]-cysteine methyltransferase